jgi:hypothetical protein
MGEFEYAQSIDGDPKHGCHTTIDGAPAARRGAERRRHLLRQHRRCRELWADQRADRSQNYPWPHLRDLSPIGWHHYRLLLRLSIGFDNDSGDDSYPERSRRIPRPMANGDRYHRDPGRLASDLWDLFMTLPFDWLIGGPPQLTPGGEPPYDPTFQSGDVQYAGPDGTLAGSINFIFGLDLPNPAGGSGPGLILGSGPGVTFFMTTDEAYTVSDPGNDLIIAAGEVQPDSTQAGGNLTCFGGSAYSGLGGTATWQGGTSFLGAGGPAVLAGGNATQGGIPGDAFVIGGSGQAPAQGANVHLIMTEVNNISGVVRIRVNSTPLIDFFANGAIYLYNGGGFGTAGQHLTSQGPGLPVIWS